MKAQLLQCAIFEEDDENILGQQDRDAQPAGGVRNIPTRHLSGGRGGGGLRGVPAENAAKGQGKASERVKHSLGLCLFSADLRVGF